MDPCEKGIHDIAPEIGGSGADHLWIRGESPYEIRSPRLHHQDHEDPEGRSRLQGILQDSPGPVSLMGSDILGSQG